MTEKVVVFFFILRNQIAFIFLGIYYLQIQGVLGLQCYKLL